MVDSSRWRHGVRFPSDINGVPSGQSGPVITYKLSPEEIEQRYGPPKKRQNQQKPEPPKPKEEVDVAQTKGSGAVSDLIREEAAAGQDLSPYFVLGAGQIRVGELAQKAQALLLLLGEDAVMQVEDGVLVVRS